MTDASREVRRSSRQRGRSGTVASAAGAATAALSAVLVSLLSPAEARAQGKTTVADRIPPTNGSGVGLNLFQPAVDGKGFFSVNGADVLGGGGVSVGLVLDYGHDMLPLNPSHGSDWAVTHAFKGVLHFDYGIAGILVVGVTAPVVIDAGGKLTDVGPGGKKDYDTDPLSAQALGDLALHVKVPILRPDGPIGVALVARAGVGVGESRNFASEPGFFYWPELVLEERVGHVLRLALNAGYRGHTGDNAVFGVARDGKPQLRSGVFESSNLFTGSFALSVRAAGALDLVAETYATYQIGGASDRRQRLSAEAMGGLKLFLPKSARWRPRSSYVSLGLGPGYAPGFQTAQVRATLGFVYEPALGDPGQKPE